jgi:DNA-binding NtrC family response regulator
VSEDIPLAKEPLLVVEDEADILESWRDNLAKEGFRVTGVTSGEEARRAVRQIFTNPANQRTEQHITGRFG